MVRFFFQSFLFALAVVLAVAFAYEVSIRTGTFPKPPPDWVAVVKDAKNTTKSLEDATGNLEKTATAIVQPLRDSIDLAKRIVEKMPKLPDAPGGGIPVPGGGLPVPGGRGVPGNILGSGVLSGPPGAAALLGQQPTGPLQQLSPLQQSAPIQQLNPVRGGLFR